MMKRQDLHHSCRLTIAEQSQKAMSLVEEALPCINFSFAVIPVIPHHIAIHLDRQHQGLKAQRT